MVIENQVCTREQGEKLESLGVTGKPLFCYCYIHSGYEEDGKLDILPTQFELAIPDLATTWVAPAFTVAELGVMIGGGYDTMYCTGEGWRCFNMEGADYFENTFPTEAQARAQMLIDLLETGSEKVEQVNQRLING